MPPTCPPIRATIRAGSFRRKTASSSSDDLLRQPGGRGRAYARRLLSRSGLENPRRGAAPDDSFVGRHDRLVVDGRFYQDQRDRVRSRFASTGPGRPTAIGWRRTIPAGARQTPILYKIYLVHPLTEEEDLTREDPYRKFAADLLPPSASSFVKCHIPGNLPFFSVAVMEFRAPHDETNCVIFVVNLRKARPCRRCRRSPAGRCRRSSPAVPRRACAFNWC